MDQLQSARSNWNKKIWLTALLLFSLILSISPCVSAEKEFFLFRTIETPHPEEHGWFGSPLKVEGDLILISSWHADVDNFAKAGKAYLYNIDGDLITTYQSPNPNMLDYFSVCLDLSGDRVLIGDSSDKGDWIWVGKAYIFDTDGTLIKTLEAPTPSRGAYFGKIVRFGSNRIIISETRGQTEPMLAGKVYLYDDEGTHLKTIYSPSPKSSAVFGQDVEDGDELFLVNEIGSRGTGGSGEIHLQGTVYGFDYDGNHVLSLQAPEPEDHACFGNSMDISGDKIIIGEYYATVDDVYRAGRAYLYNIDGEHLQTFESPSPDVGAQFGFAVSIDGNTVVIGEPDADARAGKAYVFDVDGTLLQTLTAPSPGPIAIYGYSVKVEGDTIVVGEPFAEVDGELRAGMIHLYTNDPQIPELISDSIEFNFTNLKVPEKVSKGNTATITVDCTNAGTITGSTSICMNIDDVMIENKTVTVDAGQTNTVTFTYSTGEVGVHKVEIESLVSEYKVEGGIPGFPLNAIISGILVTVYLVYHLSRKQAIAVIER